MIDVVIGHCGLGGGVIKKMRTTYVILIFQQSCLTDMQLNVAELNPMSRQIVNKELKHVKNKSIYKYNYFVNF